MPILPAELLPLIVEFAPLFSKPVWDPAKTFLAGLEALPGFLALIAVRLLHLHEASRQHPAPRTG